MKPEVVDREIVRYRLLVLELAETLAAGRRPNGLVVEVRCLMEEVICLMEAAPDDRQPEIEYLVERYDALQRQLLN